MHSERCTCSESHAMHPRRLLSVPQMRRIVSRSSLLRDHVEREPPEPTEVEALAATALLVRRSAFADVGGFDESYFLYGEDLDLCPRWRLRGCASWLHCRRRGLRTRVAGPLLRWSNAEIEWWRGTMCYATRWWTVGQVSPDCAAVIEASRLTLVRPRAGLRIWSSLLREPLAVRLHSRKLRLRPGTRMDTGIR